MLGIHPRSLATGSLSQQDTFAVLSKGGRSRHNNAPFKPREYAECRMSERRVLSTVKLRKIHYHTANAVSVAGPLAID